VELAGLALLFGKVNSLDGFARKLHFCADQAIVVRIFADEYRHRSKIAAIGPHQQVRYDVELYMTLICTLIYGAIWQMALRLSRSKECRRNLS